MDYIKDFKDFMLKIYIKNKKNNGRGKRYYKIFGQADADSYNAYCIIVF